MITPGKLAVRTLLVAAMLDEVRIVARSHWLNLLRKHIGLL